MRPHFVLFSLLALSLTFPVRSAEAKTWTEIRQWCVSLFHRATPAERSQSNLRRVVVDLGDDGEGLRKFLAEHENAGAANPDLARTLHSDLEAIVEDPEAFGPLVGWGAARAKQVDAILDFYRIAFSESSREVRIAKLVEWSSDENRARFAYERLLAGFYDRDRPLISGFLDDCLYFAYSSRMVDHPELIVTQSFEKETPNAVISLFFKPRGYDESRWFALSEGERMAKIKSLTSTRSICDKLERTSFAPPYISALYREMDSTAGKNAVYEIRKYGYHLSPESFGREMKALGKDLKEFHSFHSHVVFYVDPNDAVEFDQFKLWYLFLNDHYLLSGMEEGLHRNTKETLPIIGGAMIGSQEKGGKALGKVRTFGEVGRRTLKWFNVAVRGKIYGASPEAKLIKIGLEGRDISRKPDLIADFVERVTRAVSHRKWRRMPRDFTPPSVETFVGAKGVRMLSDAAGIDPKLAERLIDIYPEVTIPLNAFEDFPVWKIADSGEVSRGALSDRRAAEIVAARDAFREEIRSLARQIVESETKSRKSEDRDAIEMAIKWVLVDWAKAARPSEIFRGF